MDSLLIYGPPASGKSTLSKALAQRLGLPWVDLDERIVRAAGQPIPEIFAAEGEAGFRKREVEMLEQVATEGCAVVSLGGGALLDSKAQRVAEAAGKVICLKVSPTRLAARAGRAPGSRPLLEHGRLDRLLEERAAHYASFPNGVEVESDDLETNLRLLQAVAGRYRISGMGSPYEVRVESGGLERLGAYAANLGLKGPSAVVCDENTRPYADQACASLSAAGIRAGVVEIPSGEAHKTIATVGMIWRGFLQSAVERAGTVYAVGGGVVGDLTGFAAATWLRGVRWVNIPTTLLAMVDSSLGGKTGADLPDGKNLIGAFHPPALVLSDPSVLRTLPERELRCGLAESLKHAVIDDPGLFGCLSTALPDASLIARSLSVKARIICEDPYEKGRRAALNLGHTIGHAVEKASNFSIAHGEAVAIGLIAAARLAIKARIARPDLLDKLVAKTRELGLPTEIPAHLDRDEMRQALSHDKKRKDGIVRFVLPADLGDVRLDCRVDDPFDFD